MYTEARFQNCKLKFIIEFCKLKNIFLKLYNIGKNIYLKLLLLEILI